MIRIENVSKWYGDFQVLKNCSTSVKKGEVVVICGPSGSGKSTLIKTVNGLEDFQEGTIYVNNINIGDPHTNLPKLRAHVGMVFQHFELFPHLTIRDNLTLAQMKVLKRSRDQANKRGMELLDRVGLIKHADKFPLSFPAVSSSVWPSPALLQWIRSACSLTNRLLRLTRK